MSALPVSTSVTSADRQKYREWPKRGDKHRGGNDSKGLCVPIAVFIHALRPLPNIKHLATSIGLWACKVFFVGVGFT